MARLTGNDVFQALMRHPEFSGQPKEVIEATKSYYLAIPTVLASFLDKKASIETIARAKIAFLSYCFQNTFIETATNAMPKESLGIFSRAGIITQMSEVFEELLSVLSALVNDIPGFLESQGVTESELMEHPKGIGLTGEALKKYRKGRLTIADLLILQPEVIIKNS